MVLLQKHAFFAFLRRLVILCVLELTAYGQYFSNHEQTKLYSTLSESEANSAMSCCYQCRRVDTCRSVSYNDATRECFLSKILNSDISENSETGEAWTTFSIYAPGIAQAYDDYQYNSVERGLIEAGYSEEEICETDPLRTFTQGVNDDFPGCGVGWCCIIKR